MMSDLRRGGAQCLISFRLLSTSRSHAGAFLFLSLRPPLSCWISSDSLNRFACYFSSWTSEHQLLRWVYMVSSNCDPLTLGFASLRLVQMSTDAHPTRHIARVPRSWYVSPRAMTKVSKNRIHS